jgi:hypothetical protein
VRGLQVGVAGHLVGDHSDRGQHAAGEDVALDEVAMPGVVLEVAIVDDDGLQQHGAVGVQQLAAAPEVLGIVAGPTASIISMETSLS